MTKQEKLYATIQALMDDGDLEVEINGHQVVEVTLYELRDYQAVLLGTDDNRTYPVEDGSYLSSLVEE